MINPKICPFCDKENLCEAHIPDNSCWCNTIKVPMELRELISEDKRMKACICKNCIEAFKKDSEAFRIYFNL